jgi:hypothetical protein
MHISPSRLARALGMPTHQLLISQIQAIALVSYLPEPLNESYNCFIVPLFESGQISNLHLMNAREEIIMDLLLQIRSLDDRVSR